MKTANTSTTCIVVIKLLKYFKAQTPEFYFSKIDERKDHISKRMPFNLKLSKCSGV